MTDESGDSEDLQALFDSISTATRTPPPPVPGPDPSGDSDDLQALFDSVAAASGGAAPGAGPVPEPPGDDVVFNRLGKLARQLHDSLRELGYDKMLEDTARQIPDARQRLAYIAQMTEQAASRVLNATDIASPIQDELRSRSAELGQRWERMFANQLSVDDFKRLAADTRAYFNEAPAKHQAIGAQLTEIMLAQDFQDLTGQVIKKVVELANDMERQMLNVLIEVMPEARKMAAPEGLMNGPAINAAGRDDVVSNQSQVDDLLESLGF